MIFGVTGTNGAGKGTVVDYLRDEKGFAHYSVRDLIIEEVTRRGLPLDRIHIGDTGTALRRENAPTYFIDTFVQRAHDAGETNVVIESIRTLAEAKRIQELVGNVIAVDAPVELRYARITERGSATDHVTFEQFREQEDREYTAKDDSDPTQMSVLKVMDIADFVIVNDGSLYTLNEQIEKICT
jgi:dephospho-CoA kinase